MVIEIIIDPWKEVCKNNKCRTLQTSTLCTISISLHNVSLACSNLVVTFPLLLTILMLVLILELVLAPCLSHPMSPCMYTFHNFHLVSTSILVFVSILINATKYSLCTYYLESGTYYY